MVDLSGIDTRVSFLVCLGASALGGSACMKHARPPEVNMPSRTETRFTLGDFVVFQYDGSLLGTPVTITEEIVARDGNQLEIFVVAQRAEARRRWIQVVTDTQENRANEKVDELYEVLSDSRVRLMNEENRDLYRLYSWIVPPRGAPSGAKIESRRIVEVAGRQYDARCIATPQRLESGRRVRSEVCTSDEFLWNMLGSEIVAEDDGEVLYRVRVRDAGQREL